MPSRMVASAYAAALTVTGRQHAIASAMTIQKVSGSVLACTTEKCVLNVFFFQAEDGIRDLIVTGVQTCALPISQRQHGRRPHAMEVGERPQRKPPPLLAVGIVGKQAVAGEEDVHIRAVRDGCKIGRASCRERG